MIELCRDALSGFLPLCDELTGELRAGVQFWQRDARSPLLLRLFAEDGLSLHRLQDGRAVTLQPRRPYASGARRIPLVAFWGNEEHQSELSPAIRSKIDCYDRILSDFADNLDRANDVYWVLNNFSGTADDIAQMLEEIARLKAVCNYADGSGGASAEPHVLAVPYEARETALRLLERELYKDYMALDMDELTGGSLTNVAIRAASAALDLKCNRFEWQAFAFVQGILRLLGADTDAIRFQRQTIANESETVRDIAVMRGDIDLRTALRLNPYIQTEEVGEIARLAAPSAPSAPSGRSCSED